MVHSSTRGIDLIVPCSMPGVLSVGIRQNPSGVKCQVVADNVDHPQLSATFRYGLRRRRHHRPLRLFLCHAHIVHIILMSNVD